MAPVNICGQPITLVEELRRQGIDAHLLQYGSRGHRFGYKTDRVVDLRGGERAAGQMETVKACLDEGFDIFHFFLRTLFYGGGPTGYKDAGLDLPFIKNRGRRIVYRFTGFDVRLKSEHIKKNPYHPYQYGYTNTLDEDIQKRYLAFLQQYVDQFIVPDPEMHEFFPEAIVIRRAINLQDWSYVGVQPNDCPLIIHAPSDPLVKGTKFIVSALEDLKAEGLKFSFKLISDMNHSEAAVWYRRADIVVDQLCIGWYANFAMECMALGKPVIVYIREGLEDSPDPSSAIENANPDNIKEKLRSLIKDFDRRSELGKLGRQYVEQVHDVRKVVPQWIDVYTKVLKEPPVEPSSFTDIDYFLTQYQLTHEELPKLRYKARSYDKLLKELPGLRYKARKSQGIITAIAFAPLRVKPLRWLFRLLKRHRKSFTKVKDGA